MTPRSRALIIPRDKLKSLYLYYHNAYGHQTWQDGDLPWLSFNHKVIWPYNHMALWDHYRSLWPQNVAGRLLTLSDSYPQTHIITWSCKIMWQTKMLIYPLTQCLWLSILAEWDIRWQLPFHKVTRFFDHVVLKGHVNYFSCGITTTTRTMATKFGKVVTYYKKLQSTKSHKPLSIRSREIN